MSRIISCILATGGRRGRISPQESNEKTAPRSEEAFNAMKSQELYRRKISSVEGYDSHEAGGKGSKVGNGTARKSKETKKPNVKPSVAKVPRLRSKAEPDNRVPKKQPKAPVPNQVKAIGIAMDEDLEDGTYEDVNIIGR
ncbi:hypothetical protein Aduo_010311 [Ancylostoma duodenale]